MINRSVNYSPGYLLPTKKGLNTPTDVQAQAPAGNGTLPVGQCFQPVHKRVGLGNGLISPENVQAETPACVVALRRGMPACSRQSRLAGLDACIDALCPKHPLFSISRGTPALRQFDTLTVDGFIRPCVTAPGPRPGFRFAQRKMTLEI